jgi:hypothetical protein
LANKLRACHTCFDPNDGVQKCGTVLKKNENERFETWIKNQQLSKRGKTFATLSLTEKITWLKETLMEKEETDCVELDADMNKFFRRFSTSTKASLMSSNNFKNKFANKIPTPIFLYEILRRGAFNKDVFHANVIIHYL